MLVQSYGHNSEMVIEIDITTTKLQMKSTKHIHSLLWKFLPLNSDRIFTSFEIFTRFGADESVNNI